MVRPSALSAPLPPNPKTCCGNSFRTLPVSRSTTLIRPGARLRAMRVPSAVTGASSMAEVSFRHMRRSAPPGASM